MTRIFLPGFCDGGDALSGTYNGSFTWFDAEVLQLNNTTPSTDETSQKARLIQHNVTASLDWRLHTITWNRDSQDSTTKAWIEQLKPGDTIAVFARAQFPGWVNFVRSVRVDIFGNV